MSRANFTFKFHANGLLVFSIVWSAVFTEPIYLLSVYLIYFIFYFMYLRGLSEHSSNPILSLRIDTKCWHHSAGQAVPLERRNYFPLAFPLRSPSSAPSDYSCCHSLTLESINWLACLWDMRGNQIEKQCSQRNICKLYTGSIWGHDNCSSLKLCDSSADWHAIILLWFSRLTSQHWNSRLLTTHLHVYF